MAKPGKRRGRRINAKGRNDTEQFVAVPYNMARSAAFRSLHGPALKVWMELRSRYNGRNNGGLSLSLDEGAKLLAMSKTTVGRTFVELEEKGFIVMTRRGRWYGRLATAWAVTDRSHNGHLPTNAWKHWRPKAGGARFAPKRAPLYRDGQHAGSDGTL